MFCVSDNIFCLLEDWKRALDNNECVAAIFMDLPKAFDCLPHDLLKAKLKAYGLSARANHLNSYRTNTSGKHVRVIHTPLHPTFI